MPRSLKSEKKPKKKRGRPKRKPEIVKEEPKETPKIKGAIVKFKDDRSIVPDATNLEKLGNYLVSSQLFPSAKNASQAITIIEYGRELGLKPVQALQTMSIVKGRVCIEAKVYLAIANSKGLTHKVVKSDEKVCEIEFKRKNFEPHTEKFTLEDAQRAGTTTKDSFKHYPKQMLFWRCIANGVRAYAPDLCLGLYTREELETAEPIAIPTHHVPEATEPTEEEEYKTTKKLDEKETEEKEETIKEIKYRLVKLRIEIKDFKKFLEDFQVSGTKKQRSIVGYKFGNLSFHEGQLEDLKLIIEDKNWAFVIEKFREWEKTQVQEPEKLEEKKIEDI